MLRNVMREEWREMRHGVLKLRSHFATSIYRPLLCLSLALGSFEIPIIFGLSDDEGRAI